jgi:uncharacterized membrane protein YphA (DoxX/SURF4 family)
MTRIELPEDSEQPARVTVGQTLLRVALGGILIFHGVMRLLAFNAWQDELASRFALLEPDLVAHALIGMEIAGGAGLIFGWFTRLSSLALLGSSAVTIGLEVARQSGLQGGVTEPFGFELPALLAVCGLFFLLAGPGPVSLDHWLKARARRKAIEKDDMWLSYPYVAIADEPSEDDSDGYPPDRFNPSLATRR